MPVVVTSTSRFVRTCKQMNGTRDRRGMPRRGAAIALLLLLGTSFGVTIACWGGALQLSSQFSNGFSINLQTIPTSDGYSYQMYEIVPGSVVASPAGSIPCILVIHGLGGSKELMLQHALSIAANGYVVLVPDTRGQNSHTGPFSFGVDDVTDLRELITWIETATHLPMVNKSSIGVFGHSMGALLALLLAAQEPRVSCTVEASGPSNMTRVLETEWFRISLIGSPVDIDDPIEVGRRTPLTYCNATNPRNLMIVHGRNDTSVLFDHALDLNASVNPLGSRSDFRFLSYDSGHDLGDPSPMNASRTCFTDAIANAVLWYDVHLKHDASKTYDDVVLFERAGLASEMNQAYQAMYIVLLVTIVFLFFVIVLVLQFSFQKAGLIVSKGTDGTEPHASPALPVNGDAFAKQVRRQLVYMAVYIATFAITGMVVLSSPVSLVLKTIIFPIIPLVPVALVKAKGERSSGWFADLGLSGMQTIISVASAFITFAIYMGLYNAFTVQVYSRMTVIPYVLQGATGIVLPALFWYILPGLVALLLVDTTYFQEVFTILLARVKQTKPRAVLGHWFVRALLVSVIVGGIHTLGTVLFNALLPDYDLRLIGSLQFMFKELLAILSFGIITGFVLMALVATRFTKNLPGAAVIVGLILSLLYITVVPRIF